MFRKILLAGLALAAAGHVFARGSTPTCTTAPTNVKAGYNYCTDPRSGGGFTNVPEDTIRVTWSAPTCNPSITKYALEVTVNYYYLANFPTSNCDNPDFTQTWSFTTEDNSTFIDIPFSAFDLPDTQSCIRCCVTFSGDNLPIRVKALTTNPKGSNKSQNNPFSVFATGVDVCD
jgi:hypothetical protein